ncbi:hypothetical protein VTK73DRAFT_2628 [Phialemonium thermophilum]|uniref:UTP23 sensor motif region domain-containing protein n=1 Tax=Phialemonium thermophilum TaxID=223376 RepID=A0ABR3X3X2_9PEZI
MRGKRSKQYRKLMQQLSITFGFRQPYQCIVDADMVKDTTRFKMDLVASLERTLHGKVKPLITQCSIRHLYKQNTDPTVAAAIEVAKTVCERRRCGHHPDQYPEPLSTLDCLTSIVDPSGNGTNKHRYCVASQDLEVRRRMRRVRGVPLIYVSRSVMIMEPLSSVTAEMREREEASKFRDGLIRTRGKRKRGVDDDGERERADGRGPGDDSDDNGSGSSSDGDNDSNGPSHEDRLQQQQQRRSAQVQQQESQAKKKSRRRGPKGPNPLSVRKPKKATGEKTKKKTETKTETLTPAASAPVTEADTPSKSKRKRRRRHKKAGQSSEEQPASSSQAAEGSGEATVKG